ncbi:hypothetical protein, partial [Neobacillus drentensis]|uniref:hypothetical protein n=1 Tax=Neobacillus drentensis TaxID=220684 RepID=UPI001C3F2FE5
YLLARMINLPPPESFFLFQPISPHLVPDTKKGIPEKHPPKSGTTTNIPVLKVDTVMTQK